MEKCSHSSVVKLLGIVLFTAAFLVLGFSLYKGLINFRSYDRYITVKGLAIKDVDADLAVWSLSFTATAETLTDAQNSLTANEQLVRDFLNANGITNENIRLQNISVFDRQAQMYGGNETGKPRFVLSQTLVARTSDIGAMQKASQNISDLVKKGVTIGDPNGGNNQVPRYIFTKLNDVKPELIAEATKNARLSAEQFAKDSGQNVGKIRTANQGTIIIESRDPGVNEMDSPQKSVRVVSTIDYFLAQ